MPRKTVTDYEVTPEQEEVWRLKEHEGLSFREIAAKIGQAYSSVQRKYTSAKAKKQKEQRLDPEILSRLRDEGITDLRGLHSGWLLDKDGQGSGSSLYFYLGKDGPLDAESYLEMLRAAFEDIPAAPVTVPRQTQATNKTGLLVRTDLHYGGVITEDEGGTVYNREAADHRYVSGTQEMLRNIGPVDTLVILENGDITHADNDKDATPGKGHKLKVEGSHHENITRVAHHAVWSVEMGLRTAENVVYVARKGNHDPGTPAPMGLAVEYRFRDEPRVTVAHSNSPYYVHQSGKFCFVTHHGNSIPVSKMAEGLPYRFRREFGASDHHYLITGDKHHAKGDTFGGLRWLQLPSMCPTLQHETERGYCDTSGMRGFRFCDERGLVADYTIEF